MTQGTLIRKLCTYTQPNPTRRAIFEFDKMVRSIYTLRYIRNPQLQRDVQRSQNRLESYHQLRAAIAQVGGKKELTGKTDMRQEGTHRHDRHRDRDQQPVRETDRERDHLLQLCHPVAIACQVRVEPECESSRHDQEGLAGGLAPYPSERTLYLSRQRAGDRL